MRPLLHLTLEKRPLQCVTTLTCLLLTFCSGCHFAWSSLLVGEDYPILSTKQQSSWMEDLHLLGCGIGAIFTGALLDVVGRKVLLIISSVTFLFSWTMAAFAASKIPLLFSRYLAGFSDGLIFVATPIYIGEICDPEIRGLLSSSITIAYVFGSGVMTVLGSYVTVRGSAEACAIISMLFLIIFPWLPESPTYYLIKSNGREARCSLVAFKGEDGADRALNELSSSLTKVSFFYLFNKTNARNVIIMMGLRFGQQFGGGVAFIFYAQTVFKKGVGTISPLLSVVMFYAIQILFSLVGSVLIDRIGRKPLLIVSAVGSATALLAEGLFLFIRDVRCLDTSNNEAFPIVMLIIFVITYSLALQTVPSFTAAEIFPSNVKAYGTAASDVYYFIFAVLASKYFQYTKDKYGLYVPFLMFSICCFLGLSVIFFIPETKNKTLEDIQSDITNSK